MSSPPCQVNDADWEHATLTEAKELARTVYKDSVSACGCSPFAFRAMVCMTAVYLSNTAYDKADTNFSYLTGIGNTVKKTVWRTTSMLSSRLTSSADTGSVDTAEIVKQPTELMTSVDVISESTEQIQVRNLEDVAQANKSGTLIERGNRSKILYVAWRGSTYKRMGEDFKNDIYGYMVDLPDENRAPSGLRVHASVYDLYKDNTEASAEHSKKAWWQIVMEQEDVKHVVFCGHSLGGALALFSVYDAHCIQNRGCRLDSTPFHRNVVSRFQDITFEAITIGAIPVGNYEFTRQLRQLQLRCFRNEGDGLSKLFVMHKNAAQEYNDPSVGARSMVFEYSSRRNTIDYSNLDVKTRYQKIGPPCGLAVFSEAGQCTSNGAVSRLSNSAGYQRGYEYLSDHYYRVFSADENRASDIFTRTPVSSEVEFSLRNIMAYKANHNSVVYYNDLLITFIKLFLRLDCFQFDTTHSTLEELLQSTASIKRKLQQCSAKTAEEAKAVRRCKSESKQLTYELSQLQTSQTRLSEESTSLVRRLQSCTLDGKDKARKLTMLTNDIRELRQRVDTHSRLTDVQHENTQLKEVVENTTRHRQWAFLELSKNLPSVVRVLWESMIEHGRLVSLDVIRFWSELHSYCTQKFMMADIISNLDVNPQYTFKFDTVQQLLEAVEFANIVTPEDRNTNEATSVFLNALWTNVADESNVLNLFKALPIQSRAHNWVNQFVTSLIVESFPNNQALVGGAPTLEYDVYLGHLNNILPSLLRTIRPTSG